MFSAKRKPPNRDYVQSAWRRARKRISYYLSRGLRPRVSMRVWLTALFMLVTAFAAVTAYEIVRPIIYDSLNRASKATFQQVGEQFEEQLARFEQRNEGITTQYIKSFAATRGLDWAIVSADGEKLDGNAEDWLAGVVNRAVSEKRPVENLVQVETGDLAGQLQATYAVPIDATQVAGEENAAVVFNRFFTASDVENEEEALRKINQIAFLAGALALLIAGVAGYVVATLISRRVSRLGLAAERLAAGNFDERIRTRVEDEIGFLGATFNSMAASLKDAFGQVEQEKERGAAILDGMTDAVVGVDKDLNAVFLNPRARELLESSDLDFHTRLQEVLAKTRYSGPVTEPEAEAGDRIIEIRAAPWRTAPSPSCVTSPRSGTSSARRPSS